MTENSKNQKLVESLHPFERKIIPYLSKTSSFSELSEKSGLEKIKVMRALQWLENKKVLKIKSSAVEKIVLDTNGIVYLKKGLPEKRFLKTVSAKPLSLRDVQKKADLEPAELNVCIGLLKSKAAINMTLKKEIEITSQGEKLLEKKWLEEEFLKKLSETELNVSELNPEEKFAFDIFKKRKQIIKTIVEKTKSFELTPLGNEISKTKIKDTKDVIDKLTQKILKTGSWKKKSFRRYDVNINVPNISRGKRHFVNQATEYAKNIWIEMGFKEMTGPMISTSFWNFDALFTAQDHPVRDIQDTFFIGHPAKGSLPEKKLVNDVKSVHEDGGKTGSKGWKYKWSPEEAKKNVLRTHTTVLSALKLAKLKKSDLPAKFFAVGKCFRNETVDWCHLFEFNQAEGIVVDPKANFRNLLGYLRQFFTKMGFPKARFRPAYFPYTEPSVEIDIYHPVHKKWIELGGAGIFRPELTVPLLGEPIPVLAWGPGFDRIMLEYYGITDIRDLYKNDIDQLRKIKEWMK